MPSERSPLTTEHSTGVAVSRAAGQVQLAFEGTPSAWAAAAAAAASTTTGRCVGESTHRLLLQTSRSSYSPRDVPFSHTWVVVVGACVVVVGSGLAVVVGAAVAVASAVAAGVLALDAASPQAVRPSVAMAATAARRMVGLFIVVVSLTICGCGGRVRSVQHRNPGNNPTMDP